MLSKVNYYQIIGNVKEIVATQDNKVPKVRQDTLAWITRCLKNTKTVPKRTALGKVVKPLANFVLTVSASKNLTNNFQGT